MFIPVLTGIGSLILASSLDSQAVTVAGDGYRGRMSPHTPNEKFEGATVLTTLQVH